MVINSCCFIYGYQYLLFHLWLSTAIISFMVINSYYFIYVINGYYFIYGYQQLLFHLWLSIAIISFMVINSYYFIYGYQ